MPTAFMSMLPRPCATGLLRPKRLFEVDGTTGGAPSSHCGLEARGGHGLPPATAPSIMPESAPRELQGGTADRRWRGRGPSAARGIAPSTMLRMVPGSAALRYSPESAGLFFARLHSVSSARPFGRFLPTSERAAPAALFLQGSLAGRHYHLRQNQPQIGRASCRERV